MVLRRHFCYYFASCFCFGAIVCFLRLVLAWLRCSGESLPASSRGSTKIQSPRNIWVSSLKNIIFIDVLIMKYFRCLKILGLLNTCPISLILMSNAKFCNVNTHYSRECTINKQLHKSDSQPRLRSSRNFCFHCISVIYTPGETVFKSFWFFMPLYQHP